jgi:hypothetical protein
MTRQTLRRRVERAFWRCDDKAFIKSVREARKAFPNIKFHPAIDETYRKLTKRS